MSTTSWPTPQDLDDLQGDVVLGIPKRNEDFIFFTIQDASSFKVALKALIPAITTTAQIQKIRKDINEHKHSKAGGLLKCIGINISFSKSGLTKLGITDDLNDQAFNSGQLADAQALGDVMTTDANGKPTPKWLDAFKNNIDGIILVAGDSKPSVTEGVNKVEHVLGSSVKEVLKVEGQVRPGKEKGHEHFGFMDGISNPAIEALTGHLPGQVVVDSGILICGAVNDPVQNRPSWAKNGSFLAYRQLQQLVPEFDKFLFDNPLPGPPRDQGSALLGARLVGRWKSGAPVQLAPLMDDPALAADPQRNNNFNYTEGDGLNSQDRCPFSAHVRKTNPRDDLGLTSPGLLNHLMVRQGIPYGPEVTEEEVNQHTTKHDRGLAFLSYQSSITNGFEFVQRSWANNTGFIFGKPNFPNPGFDPIIGQLNGAPRETLGTEAGDVNKPLTLPIEFVVPKGGAYFFTPSITALKTKLTA